MWINENNKIGYAASALLAIGSVLSIINWINKWLIGVRFFTTGLTGQISDALIIIGMLLIASIMFVKNQSLLIVGGFFCAIGYIISLIIRFGFWDQLYFTTKMGLILGVIVNIFVLISGVVSSGIKKISVVIIVGSVIMMVRILLDHVETITSYPCLADYFDDLTYVYKGNWGAVAALSGKASSILIGIGRILFGIAMFQRNKNVPSHPSENKVVVDNDSSTQISRLSELKSLLDKGIITQEEFDKKKKEILKDY